MENLTVIAYSIYIPVTVLMTILVAKSLFSNSKIFMLDIFDQRKEIAFSTNHLFRTGFYLVNIGMAFLIIKMSGITGTQTLFEELTTKVGGFSIYLGIMLFINLFLFFRGKRKATQRKILREELQKMGPDFQKNRKSRGPSFNPNPYGDQ